MILLLSWLWTLGKFFWSIAPAAFRPDIRRFRASLVYPAAYTPIFYLLAVRPVPSFASIGILLPLHLIAMFCMFYNLYFVAKTLKLAESQTRASFYDYAGQFFLLWFFPIGIWILQPRINNLAASHGTTT